jgi:hypothetical protein
VVSGIDHTEPVQPGTDARGVSYRYPEPDALTAAFDDDRIPIVLDERHPHDPSQERRCRFRLQVQCLVGPAPQRGERLDIVA